MNRPTATGSFPVMDSWKDNTAYCARRHKYGPIQSLADEAREAGEPSFWTGLAVVLSFAAVVLAVAVMS